MKGNPPRRSDSLLVRPRVDEEGTADSGGVSIAWRRYGTGGDNIVLVPTWNFVDSRVVRRQIDGLRDEFRVVTFDARGSGASGAPSKGYAFRDHAADVLAVLDASNTPRATLVGASRGSHAAVLVATQHAERITKLVLVAPAIDVPTDSASGSQASDEPDSSAPDWRTEYGNFVPWFIERCFPEPGSATTIADITAIGLEANHRMLLQQADETDWDEVPRLLSHVRCPTLVIHGTDDVFLEVNVVKAVAAAVRSSQLALLPGLGHRPDISRPDIVNPLISEFVAS